MPRTIRFHLDENVDPAVAVGMTRRGADVTTTAEIGLGGSTDNEQIEYCIRDNRVIFTTDQDFLKLHVERPEHRGIVFAHQHRTGIGEAIRGLMLIWELLEPDEMAGRLEYL